MNSLEEADWLVREGVVAFEIRLFSIIVFIPLSESSGLISENSYLLSEEIFENDGQVPEVSDGTAV